MPCKKGIPCPFHDPRARVQALNLWDHGYPLPQIFAETGIGLLALYALCRKAIAQG
jgi:hypothetical protein